MKRVLSMLGLAIGVAWSAEAPHRSRDSGEKLLLMHYMPWYETPEVRGRWGSHWTGPAKQHDPSRMGDDGLRDIWSHYHPLIGLYDSTDEAVIECQLLQMKLAGVDGVIVDWYGLSKAADYPPIHAATQAVFRVAERLGVQFAICYEDRTVGHLVKSGALPETKMGDHLGETFQWMSEAWFGASHYVRLDGRPLLLNFGPIHVKDAGSWDEALASVEGARPAYYALHHLWKGIGADGGFTWIHPDAWKVEEGAREAPKLRLAQTYRRVAADPRQVIVSAFPGFRDVYEESHPTIEHRDGQTLQASLEVCLEGDWPIVQLATWNDYGEGTMIEPTHEFGYRFLEIIHAARHESSSGPAANPAILRLPARLLELRRGDDADEKDLDEIARLLATGALEEAKARLDKASVDAASP